MYSAMQSMQRPSSSNMAEELFSNIDTSNKGYIEQADLESAMSSLSDSSGMMSSEELFSALDSDSDGKITQDELAASFENAAAEMRVRGHGEMGPPPPPQEEDEGFTAEQLSEMASESDDTVMADLFSQLAENFDEADTNGDGKITHDEAMAFDQSVNGTDESQMKEPGPMGPPPEDPGFSQAELSEMASSTDDSMMADLFSQLAENFDEADANGDGVVTRDEAMAFEQSTDDSTESASQTVTQQADAQLMRTISALMKTYLDEGETSSFTASA
jgi:Ca2+-binding EF-hand superfamily protein